MRDAAPQLKEAIKAIYLYTYDKPAIYSKVNEVLRGQDIEDKDLYKDFANILNTAIDIICQNVSSKCVTNGEAFRGQIYKETFTKNTEYSFKSFTSTSSDISVALNFITQTSDSVLFYLTGVNGIKVKDYSRFPNENEILMKPGTKFNIENIYATSQEVSTFLKEYRVTITTQPEKCVELSKTQEPVKICYSLTSGVSKVTVGIAWLLIYIHFI